MEYSNQKTDINQLISTALDANFEETPIKECKKCKRKSKKSLRWMLFWGFYCFIFLVWGHISLIKFIMSLF
jgi:hypothetical protein